MSHVLNLSIIFVAASMFETVSRISANSEMFTYLLNMVCEMYFWYNFCHVYVLQSEGVCSAELVVGNFNTRKNVTIETTVDGDHIIFNTTQLATDQHYWCSLNASNQNGSRLSHFNISKFKHLDVNQLECTAISPLRGR